MSADRRSFNNADLSPIESMAFRKKGAKVTQVQLKLGGIKITLPMEATVLKTVDGQYSFVGLQAINAVLESRDGEYQVVHPKDNGTAVKALKAVRKSVASQPSKSGVPEIPKELEAMLKQLPTGYKLGIKDGAYALVKTRERRTKKN